MSRQKSIKIDDILDAAEEILLRDGLRNFTLDKIAQEANVSKGGLTYNFKSKDCLIKALIRREISRFSEQVSYKMIPYLPDSRAMLLGYIDATKDEEHKVTARAISMLSTFSQTPELSSPIRRRYRNVLNKINSIPNNSCQSRLAFFATEGMFMLDGMGILQISRDEKEAILEDAKSLCMQSYPFSLSENIHYNREFKKRSSVSTSISSRQTRSSSRMDHIVNTAMHIISRDGINALTHRSVAKEAGVPLGSTTYYFSNLDDLLTSVMVKAIAAFQFEMCDWIELNTGRDISETLASFVLNKLNDINKLSREYEIFAAAISRPSLRPLALEWSNVVIELLKTVVPTEAALPLGAVINGFLIRGFLEGERHQIDYVTINKVISSLLKCLVRH